MHTDETIQAAFNAHVTRKPPISKLEYAKALARCVNKQWLNTISYV